MPAALNITFLSRSDDDGIVMTSAYFNADRLKRCLEHVDYESTFTVVRFPLITSTHPDPMETSNGSFSGNVGSAFFTELPPPI